MENDKVNEKLKRQHLKDLNDTNLINYIKDVCSEYYNIDQIYLELPTRKREVITLRHMVYFFIKRYLYEMPFASIGQLFAKQNHATVLYAVKNIQNLAEFDKQIKADISCMDSKIKAHAVSLGIQSKTGDMFVDFNNLQLISLSKEKHIALIGMDERDVKKIVKLFSAKEVVDYTNTGLYLVEKKK